MRCWPTSCSLGSDTSFACLPRYTILFVLVRSNFSFCNQVNFKSYRLARLFRLSFYLFLLLWRVSEAFRNIFCRLSGVFILYIGLKNNLVLVLLNLLLLKVWWLYLVICLESLHIQQIILALLYTSIHLNRLSLTFVLLIYFWQVPSCVDYCSFRSKPELTTKFHGMYQASLIKKMVIYFDSHVINYRRVSIYIVIWFWATALALMWRQTRAAWFLHH